MGLIARKLTVKETGYVWEVGKNALEIEMVEPGTYALSETGPDGPTGGSSSR